MQLYGNECLKGCEELRKNESVQCNSSLQSMTTEANKEQIICLLSWLHISLLTSSCFCAESISSPWRKADKDGQSRRTMIENILSFNQTALATKGPQVKPVAFSPLYGAHANGLIFVGNSK